MILLAGPCVIESKKSLFKIAENLMSYHKNKNIDFYFKASFDKANRTSLDSFRGVGIKKGISLLKKIKETFGYKIVTDVHETHQIKEVSKVVDMLQIPAFLSRQTDLLVEVAKSDCAINIKKGQFLAPKDMEHVLLKVLRTRGFSDATYDNSLKARVWVSERGSSFGYNNLVVDMRGIMIMRKFAPVIFDATHSVQMPSLNGKTSGGQREFVAPLSRAACSVGVDGFFFEVHYCPSKALSDGANSIKLKNFDKIIGDILNIENILGGMME